MEHATWYEEELPGGARQARYQEPVVNLDGPYLAGGLSIHISATVGWQPDKLILRCAAYEPIGYGRQMSLTRTYDLSVAGYAAAHDAALAWLPSAQAFVARALGLVEEAPRKLFSAIIHREEVQFSQPHLAAFKTDAAGLRSHLAANFDLECALAWLKERGYIARVGDEWHSAEWVVRERKGAKV